MKRTIDLSTWPRREYYEFFGSMPDPYWGLSAKVDFLSIKEEGMHRPGDSIPQISTGKLTDCGGRKMMTVSILVNHGLADGRHVGQFYTKLEEI